MTDAWIALNSVKGLGPVRIKQLLDIYRTPEAVFKESPSRLASSGVIPELCALQLGDASLFDEAAKEIQAAQAAGVRILTLADSEYPQYLREIFAPPPVLFTKGDISVFNRHAVAIVGTRNPTSYGRTVALSMSRELVEQGFAIISGVALGIDTIAHEACIEKGGKTIGVLGCGIDRVYPSSNKKLYDAIAASGALVSEFPIGTSPEAFNFPRRNRIISGLSAGTLVIEAGEKSGSLITAHYALQQGRNLYAVPGPITSAQSNGTFTLIRDGAEPVRCGKDIAESLKVIVNPQVMTFTSCPTPKLPLALLSDMERIAFDTLSDTPIRIDELAERCSLTITNLFDTLLNLELKGLIRQVSGQQFIRA